MPVYSHSARRCATWLMLVLPATPQASADADWTPGELANRQAQVMFCEEALRAPEGATHTGEGGPGECQAARAFLQSRLAAFDDTQRDLIEAAALQKADTILFNMPEPSQATDECRRICADLAQDPDPEAAAGQ